MARLGQGDSFLLTPPHRDAAPGTPGAGTGAGTGTGTPPHRDEGPGTRPDTGSGHGNGNGTSLTGSAEWDHGPKPNTGGKESTVHPNADPLHRRPRTPGDSSINLGEGQHTERKWGIAPRFAKKPNEEEGSTGLVGQHTRMLKSGPGGVEAGDIPLLLTVFETQRYTHLDYSHVTLCHRSLTDPVCATRHRVNVRQTTAMRQMRLTAYRIIRGELGMR